MGGDSHRGFQQWVEFHLAKKKTTPTSHGHHCRRVNQKEKKKKQVKKKREQGRPFFSDIGTLKSCGEEG